MECTRDGSSASAERLSARAFARAGLHAAGRRPAARSGPKARPADPKKKPAISAAKDCRLQGCCAVKVRGSSRPPRILGCRCSVSSRPLVHGTLRRQKHQKIATTRPTKNFQFPGEAPLRLNPSRNPCRSRAEGATLRAPPFSMKPGDESRAPDVQDSLKRGAAKGCTKLGNSSFAERANP